MVELNGINDELVMKLLHYFITNRKYSPVIIKGIDGEIWLENMSEDYKIVRIVSSYIHNDEQFKVNERRTNQLAKALGKKTLSLKMNVLSIFVNLGDNVHLDNFNNSKTNHPVNVHKTEDLNNYNFVIDAFPDITKKTNFKEKGFDLFMKITSDISKKSEGEAMKNEEFRKISSTVSYTCTVNTAENSRNPQREVTWTSGNGFYNQKFSFADNMNIVAGQTGHTSAAGFCLVLGENDDSGKEYISIIFNSPIYEQLYASMKNLAGKSSEN